MVQQSSSCCCDVLHAMCTLSIPSRFCRNCTVLSSTSFSAMARFGLLLFLVSWGVLLQCAGRDCLECSWEYAM